MGEYGGHTLIGNYGAGTGFQTHLAIFPAEGIAILALVNVYDADAGAFRAFEIGNGMADILLAVEP